MNAKKWVIVIFRIFQFNFVFVSLFEDFLAKQGVLSFGFSLALCSIYKLLCLFFFFNISNVLFLVSFEFSAPKNVRECTAWSQVSTVNEWRSYLLTSVPSVLCVLYSICYSLSVAMFTAIWDFIQLSAADYLNRKVSNKTVLATFNTIHKCI